MDYTQSRSLFLLSEVVFFALGMHIQPEFWRRGSTRVTDVSCFVVRIRPRSAPDEVVPSPTQPLYAVVILDGAQGNKRCGRSAICACDHARLCGKRDA